MCWLKELFTAGMDKPSPSDIVPRSSITTIDSNIVVSLAKLNIPLTKTPKIWIPEIPDTNSMDGIFDFGHNNILIAGADKKEQKILVDSLMVGDIAVYRIMQNPDDKPEDFSKSHKSYSIHRIIEIGSDNEGRYFKFKGDNTPVKDPYEARDSNILWVSIGTIY